jgi:hypothetical protein
MNRFTHCVFNYADVLIANLGGDVSTDWCEFYFATTAAFLTGVCSGSIKHSFTQQLGAPFLLQDTGLGLNSASPLWLEQNFIGDPLGVLVLNGSQPVILIGNQLSSISVTPVANIGCMPITSIGNTYNVPPGTSPVTGTGAALVQHLNDIVPVEYYSVTGASNASPIVISTSAPTSLVTGDFVTIAGVAGNTAANVTSNTITVLTPVTFSLTGTTGNGTYTSGGTVTPQNKTPDILTTGAPGITQTQSVSGAGSVTALRGSRVFVDVTGGTCTVNAPAIPAGGGPAGTQFGLCQAKAAAFSATAYASVPNPSSNIEHPLLPGNYTTNPIPCNSPNMTATWQLDPTGQYWKAI